LSGRLRPALALLGVAQTSSMTSADPRDTDFGPAGEAPPHMINAMSYPPQPPPGARPPYGYGQPVPADHPQATAILVLGILGLVFCQMLGPFAWVMGRRALKEIDSSGGTIGGRAQVGAGYVCGIVATVLMVLSVVIVVVVLVIGLVSLTGGSAPPTAP
jgi:hypothetical protein